MTSQPEWNPARTLDDTITRRADWTPATRDHGGAALLLTATLQAIEAAALLGASRLALALDTFETTPNNIAESKAA